MSRDRDLRQLYDSLGEGRFPLPSDYSCDVFVSAFNLSQRVRSVFDQVSAPRKCWVLHQEYDFASADLPEGAEMYTSAAQGEADFVVDVMRDVLKGISSDARVCIDSTGFMRPHLMFLLLYCRESGFLNVDVIYTEPSHYVKKAETVFSSDVIEVRQVEGYEGAHSTDLSKDILLIGCGYDHDLISEVISYKGGARILQLLSLPSLSADMYQESLVRLQRVVEAPGSVAPVQIAYAAANDPFATFMAVESALQKIYLNQGGISNIYMSPLATKPQVIGFCMYYLKRLNGSSASLVFPFARKYSKETSKGVGRSWLYRLGLS